MKTQEKNEIENIILRKYSNLPRANVFVHITKEAVPVALIVNPPEESALVKEKDFEQIEGVDSEKITNFCEKFVSKPAVLDAVGTFWTSGKQITWENFKKFMLNQKGSVTNSKLGKNNVVCAYKVLEDGSLDENIIFKMNFACKCAKNKIGDVVNRIYIEDAETETAWRGQGIYTSVLTKLLPQVAETRKIKSVVLSADAFDTNSATKGGQEKLEKFYRNCGFSKTQKVSETGKPIYVKTIYQKMSMEI